MGAGLSCESVCVIGGIFECGVGLGCVCEGGEVGYQCLFKCR